MRVGWAPQPAGQLMPPAHPMRQVFYVAAGVDRAWPPGESRAYFVYSVFAQTTGPRVRCIPHRWGRWVGGELALGLQLQTAVRVS